MSNKEIVSYKDFYMFSSEIVTILIQNKQPQYI